MRREFFTYFNENWLLAPHGEDDVLYTAQFAALSSQYTVDMAVEAIESLLHRHVHLFGPIYIDQFYPNPENKTFSHDMLTGLVCLSKLRQLSYHNKWVWFDCWRRLQPWNIAFYLFIMDNFLHYLGLLLLPILSLKMIWTIARPSKEPNGVLSSSGPLIIFLMLRTVDMPITTKIINYFLRKNIRLWSNYALAYYDTEHPVYKLMIEQGI